MRIKQDFHTSAGKSIQVEFCQTNETILEITARNSDYVKERTKILKCLVTLVALYSGYLYLGSSNDLLIIHMAFISAILFMVLLLINLVESESIKLVKNFALQTSTQYFLKRTANFFVPINYIHDVVINEVVYNYKVIFVLMALTKGEIYNDKPMIPLIKNLHPELKCLEIIYKKMLYMLNTGMRDQ